MPFVYYFCAIQVSLKVSTNFLWGNIASRVPLHIFCIYFAYRPRFAPIGKLHAPKPPLVRIISLSSVNLERQVVVLRVPQTRDTIFPNNILRFMFIYLALQWAVYFINLEYVDEKIRKIHWMQLLISLWSVPRKNTMQTTFDVQLWSREPLGTLLGLYRFVFLFFLQKKSIYAMVGLLKPQRSRRTS